MVFEQWALDDDVLHRHCDDFGKFYDSDVDGTEWNLSLQNAAPNPTNSLPTKLLELLSFIVSYGKDVFPNLRVALQIFLTKAIASCERSFS